MALQMTARRRGEAGSAEQELGYRRGVVLGLTLAETILLLLFCVLLASAAILLQKQEELDAQQAHIDYMTRQLADLGRVPAGDAPTLPPGLTPAQLEMLPALAELVLGAGLDQETARALVEASRQAAERASREPSEFWRELVLATRVVEAVKGNEEILASIGQLAPDQFAEAIETARSPESVADPALVTAVAALSPEDQQRLAALLERVKADDMAVADAAAAVDAALAAAAGGPGEHDWPPIIRLSDADGYSFDSGKANLTLAFEEVLRGRVAKQLAELVAQYKVDVVEVIGHTDEARLVGKTSNLDDQVLPAIRGEASPDLLTPGDNAGLGLARAIAVAHILSESPGLGQVEILPLSAGQTTMLGDRLSDGSQIGSVAQRRRIEIRLRRSSGVLEGPQPE